MRDRLSRAESALRSAVERGGEADLGRDIDPRAVESPEAWDGARTVRARVIDELLRDAAPSAHNDAVRLTGVRITGGLRFRYGRLARPLRLDMCWIDDVALFAELTAAGIELVRCRLPDLRTESVDVESAISVRECHVDAVTMVDTRVHRSASFEDTRFTGVGTLFHARNLSVGGDLLLNRARLFADAGTAVHSERLRVDGGLGLVGIRARGTVLLSGAAVVGQIDLTDAVLRHREGVALDARRMVAGGLDGHGLRCSGAIDLGHAAIAGRVTFDSAVLANPGGDALQAGDIEADRVEAENGTRILGRVLLPRGQVRDTLALRGVEISNPGGYAVVGIGAAVGSLVADRARLVGRVVFDEFEATSVRFVGARVTNPDDSWALSFQSATVRRDLNLERLNTKGALNIKGVRVGAGIFLDGADLDGGHRALGASRAVVGERLVFGRRFRCRGDIDLAHADVGKSLALDGSTVQGVLRLFQARVRSDVLLRGAYIEAHGIGVDAIGLRVDGRFAARGLVCDGAVRLTAAVADAVVLTGAQLYNPDANALIASRIEVRGDFVVGDDPYSPDLGSFSADGRVVMRDGSVGGDLVFDGAELRRPNHRVLDATGVQVGGKISLERAQIHGMVSFDQARVRRRIVLGETTLAGSGVGSADGPIVFSATQTTSEELLVDRGLFRGALRLTGSAFVAGVSLRHVTIEAHDSAALLAADMTAGVIRLTGLDVDGAVALPRCRVGGELLIDGGRYRHAGRIAVDAAHISVAGALIVREADLTGTLVLRRAEVGLAMQLSGVQGAVGSTPDGGASVDHVVTAVGMRVEGNVECRRLSLAGQVSFAEAVLAGRLVFHDGGRLTNPGRPALYAPDLQVAGAVEFGTQYADDTARLTVVGDIRLDRARLGEVWWEHVSISEGAVEPGPAEPIDEAKPVISLREAVVERRVLMDGLDVAPPARPGRPVVVDLSQMQAGTVELPPGESAVDLRDSAVRTLVLDPTDTTTVMLSGLTFDDPGDADVDTALSWLRRDLTGYQHQVYEQLAAHYHRAGEDAAARTVLLARQRHRRDLLGTSSFGQVLMKGWGYLQDVTVGYGYRPGLAAVWFTGLLAFGTAYFAGSELEPVETDVHPTFNPFGYTLDLLIPLLSLGQDSAWDPRGPDLWVAYGLIFCGAVLATTVVAAVTRVLNRR
ncbi:hypothetical protein CLV30_101311 [Haloactinopolyspora alba]|uniref:Membrane-associated oxidoreductase n=1 Tax=Haloactinopolyspora alba TaxID=648780 RepID=A0A2P8EFW3_9ACTN|nr:hypothetical protein [Haloactinopolyspora alba]PSL08340.1 hypothetical protein CLV30_101311 [Haloactinopolyspora alba]